jgi:hypothetical protein
VTPYITKRKLAACALPAALTILAVLVVTGCRIVQTAAEIPSQTADVVRFDRKQKHPIDVLDLQQTLSRFAEAYATQMTLSADRLQRGTNEGNSAEILKWKIGIATETCSIASGPNSIANLLDMTVFVTATRMTLEEYWQPKVFGESALPILNTSRNAETEIWRLAETVLTIDQQTELRQSIGVWRSQNPLPESVLGARAVGLVSQIAERGSERGSEPGSVFALLRVDPLSGMDPAVREIAQTRLAAERALFVTQQMPKLLRWQTELLSINAAELPAVRQLVTNSTQLGASVERFAAVAESLPAHIGAERAAILHALESQEKQLSPLVNEVRQTFTAGTQLSASLNTTLTTLETVMKGFGVSQTDATVAPKTDAEPFRIQDYENAAAQLETTARALTDLLVTLNQTVGTTNLAQLSAQAGPMLKQAQASGKEVTDYAFRKGLLLLVIACIAVLITVLIYRFLSPRILRPHSVATTL